MYFSFCKLLPKLPKIGNYAFFFAIDLRLLTRWLLRWRVKIATNEMIAEYLNAVLEDGNEDDLVLAIGHVAKSIGMSKIA